MDLKWRQGDEEVKVRRRKERSFGLDEEEDEAENMREGGEDVRGLQKSGTLFFISGQT